MARDGRSGLKLAALLALFLGLTALGLWWAAPPRETLDAVFLHVGELGAPTLAILFALALGLIAAEMLRLHVFGRAIGTHIGARAALDATIANNFFSWITPGSALGEPASTLMLARHGVDWDAAVLISFAKFATSLVFILGAGSILLALGHGPSLTPLIVAPAATAVGIAALMMLILLVSALRPARAIGRLRRIQGWLASTRPGSSPRVQPRLDALAGVLERSIERLARFREAGAPGSAAMLATHVIYYGAFVAILVVLADAFVPSSAVSVIPTAVIYQGFLYLAPTPGGAGLGEASADIFFGDTLGSGAAFAVVVLFRALTFYFHVALGLCYLPLVGALRAVLRRDRVQRDAD